jgi:hypothetical protein
VNSKIRVLTDKRGMCSCFGSSSTTTASATWRSTTPSTSAGSGRRRADLLTPIAFDRFKGMDLALGVFLHFSFHGTTAADHSFRPCVLPFSCFASLVPRLLLVFYVRPCVSISSLPCLTVLFVDVRCQVCERTIELVDVQLPAEFRAMEPRFT